MQNIAVQGILKVFCSEGCYCASFVSPGYPLLATRSEDMESLEEWLEDIGVDETVLTGRLPIEVEVSLPSIVVTLSEEVLQRRFGRKAAYSLSKVGFQPPVD